MEGKLRKWRFVSVAAITAGIVVPIVVATAPARPHRLLNTSIVNVLQAKEFDPLFSHQIVSASRAGSKHIVLVLKYRTANNAYCHRDCGNTVTVTLARGPHVNISRSAASPNSWTLFVYNRADLMSDKASKLSRESLADALKFNLDYTNVVLKPKLYKEVNPQG